MYVLNDHILWKGKVCMCKIPDSLHTVIYQNISHFNCF